MKADAMQVATLASLVVSTMSWDVMQFVRSLGLLLGTEVPVMTLYGLDFLKDLSHAACQKQIRQADTLLQCRVGAMFRYRTGLHVAATFECEYNPRSTSHGVCHTSLQRAKQLTR